MLVRPSPACHRRSCHAAARACFAGSRSSRTYSRKFASAKTAGPGIQFLAREVRTFELHWLLRQRRAHRLLVLTRVADLVVQHFADVAGEAHIAVSRLHARPGCSLFI